MVWIHCQRAAIGRNKKTRVKRERKREKERGERDCEIEKKRSKGDTTSRLELSFQYIPKDIPTYWIIETAALPENWGTGPVWLVRIDGHRWYGNYYILRMSLPKYRPSRWCLYSDINVIFMENSIFSIKKIQIFWIRVWTIPII